MRRAVPVLLVVLLALAGCAADASRDLLAGLPKPTPTPAPAATPTPAPTPTGPQPAAPFALTIAEVRVANASNGALFGVAQAPADPAAANQAADAAGAALTAFLNAQFTDPATWFSDAGIAALVDPARLDEPTRQALGQLAGTAVQAVTTGSATATADVVIDGTVLEAVTLTYATTMDVTLPTGESGPVEHAGVITFSPLQGTLTLAAVQPRTTYGGDLQAVLG